MAVTQETPIASSLANGVTTVFPHLFTVLAAADLVVQGTVGGVTTPYTLGVDYSVNGVGASSGSVQFVTPPPAGVIVTRYRDTALERATDYQTNGDLQARTVNLDFDRLWLALQDIFNGGKAPPSTLRVPDGEAVSPFPDTATRASHYAGFDAAGQPTILLPAEGTAAALAAELADPSNVAYGDAKVAVKRTTSSAVATTLHAWIERQQLHTYADFGIEPDGVTDRTATLTALLGILSGAGFRGWVRIPYATKFNVATVYAAVPVGVILDDESSINWGQPPTYKNKFRVMYSGDTVSDDTQQVIASGHHPALMLLNMGTAGSASAADRFASIAHGMGKDYDGDPLLGWMMQFAEEAGANKLRASLRVQTPWAVAMGNPQPWVTATIYAAGAYSISDGGKVYRTTAGGTSGGVAPTGTGTGINDGGVLWDYVQAALNIDSTRWDVNEDGREGLYAPAGGIARKTFQAGAKSFYFEIDDATGTITLRDVTRGLSIFTVSDAHAFRLGMGHGRSWMAMSGTGPNAPIASYGKVNNGAATNMSTMVPPGGCETLYVRLRFENANTTLVHGTGTNALRLKGAVNVTPAAGTFVDFEWDSTDTTSWREAGRSF